MPFLQPVDVCRDRDATSFDAAMIGVDRRMFRRASLCKRRPNPSGLTAGLAEVPHDQNSNYDAQKGARPDRARRDRRRRTRASAAGGFVQIPAQTSRHRDVLFRGPSQSAIGLSSRGRRAATVVNYASRAHLNYHQFGNSDICETD